MRGVREATAVSEVGRACRRSVESTDKSPQSLAAQRRTKAERLGASAALAEVRAGRAVLVAAREAREAGEGAAVAMEELRAAWSGVVAEREAAPAGAAAVTVEVRVIAAREPRGLAHSPPALRALRGWPRVPAGGHAERAACAAPPSHALAHVESGRVERRQPRRPMWVQRDLASPSSRLCCRRTTRCSPRAAFPETTARAVRGIQAPCRVFAASVRPHWQGANVAWFLGPAGRLV